MLYRFECQSIYHCSQITTVSVCKVILERKCYHWQQTHVVNNHYPVYTVL